MNFMKFKFLVLVASVTFTFLPLAAAKAEPASRESILELIRVTKSDSLGEQMMNDMIEQYKKLGTKIPDAFWDGLRGKFNTSDIIELVVPIYQKHLTEEDVQGLIEFNSSPLGQKVVDVMPRITAETVEVSMKWGYELGLEFAAEVKAELARQKAAAKGNYP